MRIRSSPRAFISYSHRDKTALHRFADLARQDKVDPVYDEKHVEPSDKLDLRIRAIIDQSDCVVCLGTRNSFASRWCKQEVEYALETDKPYYPIIADDTSPDNAPPWFRGELHPHHLGVNIAQGSDEMAYLVRLIGRNHAAFRTWCLVALCLLVFLVSPLILGYGLRTAGAMAEPIPRQWQAEIEGLNTAIEQAMPAGQEGPSGIVFTEVGGADRVYEYRDTNTGQLIVRDVFDGRGLARREFLRDSDLVAVDQFTRYNTPSGEAYVLKTRQIHVPDSGGMVVEDVFDSAGNLIGKRVKGGEATTWRQFADTGYSVYPVVLLAYR